jgi:uncharacterized damage-inducible protein DinB
MNLRYGAPVSGDEKQVLAGFLDHYRKVLLDICEGLSDEDLRRSFVPSRTSILGMIKHLAYVERGWFQEGIAGRDVEFPVGDDISELEFRIEPGETTEEVLDFYRAECAESRAILEAASLDAIWLHPQRSEDFNVRWIVVHMIEETARHAGHADILRELIDGKTETGYL